MSFVNAASQTMVAVAGNLTGIGDGIRAASALAAPSTMAITPAAADEVSTALTTLFGNYAADFQALSARTAAFHASFVQTLLNGASNYVSAEASSASSLSAAS